MTFDPNPDSVQIIDRLEPEEGDEAIETPEEEEAEQEYSAGFQAAAVMVVFVLYIVVGGIMLPMYEPDMEFFSALYFNFVTLTTVGLGDLVPKRDDFLALTLIYIAIGLALTTIAIEVASDYLQRLHYMGRKLKNAGNTAIWFGGKK